MDGTRKDLSGQACLNKIRKQFETIPDLRRQASVSIPLPDALMSGFAVFSLKYPSLLQFEQRARQQTDQSLAKGKRRSTVLLEKKHNSNLRSLYGIREIPSDTQMREILDGVDPELLRPVFRRLFEPLQRGKVLKDFEFYRGHYLLSIDGTGYFNSAEVHCDSCMKKVLRRGKPDEQTTYYHQVLAASIVHPDQSTVIPVCPEPILKQDGHDKNDCERNACRRFLAKFRQDHPRLKVIVVEDAIAANCPHVKVLKDYEMSFILGVKPTSHVQLFRGLVEQEKMGLVKHFEYREVIGQKIRKRRTHRFRYINGVLLSSGDVNLPVNFMEYWETTEWTDPKGREQKSVVHFSWVTDLELGDSNLMPIMRGGRARWKIENETFNTLKNQGYEFEHNFGHGKNNLTVVFAYLMMLAFLFDQIQEHACELFQAAQARMRSKVALWPYMRSIYQMMSIPNWSALLGIICGKGTWKVVPDTS